MAFTDQTSAYRRFETKLRSWKRFPYHIILPVVTAPAHASRAGAFPLRPSERRIFLAGKVGKIDPIAEPILEPALLSRRIRATLRFVFTTEQTGSRQPGFND